MDATRSVIAAGLATATLFLAAAAAPFDQAAPTQEKKTPGLCRDSQGGLYSPGAVLKVGDREMECVIGPHWAPAGESPAEATPDVLDVGQANLSAEHEAAIKTALSGASLPSLQCDAVLNSTIRPAQLIRVPAGERKVVIFWTPTCGPCKPLLDELAALAATRPRNLSFLGVVQAAVPDMEPPGEWRLSRVRQIVSDHKVGFPTCVHSSRELMRRWQAEGVPLTLVMSDKGVERVAEGGANGHRLIEELARPQ